jgi:hypothetical protein
MKQKELEQKDIVGYFPYDLKAYSDETNYKIWKVVKMHLNGGIILISNDKNSIGYQNIDIKELTPILYPLSSLYEKRMHNGEEIIPILELAKIASDDVGIKGLQWSMYGSRAIASENYYDPSKTSWKHEFLLVGGIFCYEMFELSDKCLPPEQLKYNQKFPNQYKIYDFLNELKIDYRGLIDAGLAIDVNTLDINPYE